MRVLWIALSLAPSALANSQCDTACELATGLVDCGFLRDCENHIMDKGGCLCTLSKEAIAIISIAVIAFIAASVCKLICKIMGSCCGDTGTRSDAGRSDADKLKADMKKLAEQMAESKAMDEAVADGRLIRTGVGTPRTLHASRSNPACGPPCLWCPARGTIRSMQEPAFAPAEATCGWMQRPLAQQ